MAATVQTSSLAALPEEILGQITEYLDSDSCFALRLCCREIESRIFSEFALEYFSRKCFMFTTESLQTFVKITESRFASYLKDVYLLTVGFSWTLTTTKRDRTFDPYRLSCDYTSDAHTEFWQDQTNLHRLGKKPGGDEYLLRRAFQRIKALSFLGFVDDAHALASDIICHGLNKWSRKLRHSYTSWPTHHVYNSSTDRIGCAWLTHVWRTTLTAVAKSGITIEHLETVFSYCKYALLPSTDLRFHPQIVSKLKKSFDKVESLSLEFRTRRNGSERPIDPQREEPPESVECARTFATIFEKVKVLHLLGDAGPSSGTTCAAIVQRLELRKMTQLHLVSININHRDLAAILCNLNSAHTIEMQNVNLESGSWSSILKVLSKLPRLNHLHLLLLTQEGKMTYFLPMEKPARFQRRRPRPTHSALLGVGSYDLGNLESEWPITDHKVEEADSADPTFKTLGVEDTGPLPWPLPGTSTSLPEGPLVWAPPSIKCSTKHPNFRPPRHSIRTPSGRGSYVCLTGWEIAACLPMMIKRCYVAVRVTHGGMQMPFHGTNNPVWAGDSVPYLPTADTGMVPPFDAPDMLNEFDFDTFLNAPVNDLSNTWPPPSPSDAGSVPPDPWMPPIMPTTGNTAIAAVNDIFAANSSLPSQAVTIPPPNWIVSNGIFADTGGAPAMPPQSETVPPPGWQPPIASGALGGTTSLPLPPPLFGPGTTPTHGGAHSHFPPSSSLGGPSPFSAGPSSLMAPTDKSLQHLDLAVAPTPLHSLQWPPPPPTVYNNVRPSPTGASKSSTIFPGGLIRFHTFVDDTPKGRLWICTKSKANGWRLQLRLGRVKRGLRLSPGTKRSQTRGTEDDETAAQKVHPPLVLPWTAFDGALGVLPAINKGFWATLFKWPGSPPPADAPPPLTARERSKLKRLNRYEPGRWHRCQLRNIALRRHKFLISRPSQVSTVHSTTPLPTFGPTQDKIDKFLDIINSKVHQSRGVTRARLLEEFEFELKLRDNRDWALRQKAADKIYTRLEREFMDCGGLLGASDFLSGEDETDNADVLQIEEPQGSKASTGESPSPVTKSENRADVAVVASSS